MISISADPNKSLAKRTANNST